MKVRNRVIIVINHTVNENNIKIPFLLIRKKGPLSDILV